MVTFLRAKQAMDTKTAEIPGQIGAPGEAAVDNSAWK
jgi:hypothetical protein